MVPVSYLDECLIHDVVTGALRWRTRPADHFSGAADCRGWNLKYAGGLAGRKNSQGYLNFTLRYQGKCHKLYAHRVAWALYHYQHPTKSIDHINHDRGDNRIANLRDVSHFENMTNRKWRPAHKEAA